MKTFTRALVIVLISAHAAPAGAETLREATARAASSAAAAQPAPSSRSPKLMWSGTALFVGGMSVGLYAFIHNKNGGFAEFGEANAVDKKLGAAGVTAAFAGGALLFMGTRKASHAAPSIAVTKSGVTVAKQISW
jgi:hypothetical protein